MEDAKIEGDYFASLEPKYVQPGHGASPTTGTVIPPTKGVRLHDLRHTAATLWLTAGVHFIQVAKWLGHSSYVLTLTAYADYIPEVEVENPRPEVVATQPSPT